MMIRPVIFPIIAPDINWDLFLREVKNYTGDTITKSMDMYGVKPAQDQTIVAGLTQFRTASYFEPHAIIRDARIILNHLHFSFLILYDPRSLMDFAVNTGLKIITHNTQSDVCVIGGTLLQWKDAIFETSKQEQPSIMRFLGNCLLLVFQNNGYSMIFESFERINLPDQTFTLRYKD